MSKKRNIQNTLIIVLGIAIIGISVAYAAFDVNMEKSYAYPETKAKFDVHLENPQKTANTSETVVEVNPLSIGEDESSVNFKATLNPGETYEFTIDVRNSGNLSAKLVSYELIANNEKLPKTGEDVNSYLSYEIKGIEDNEVIRRGDYNIKRITIKANENMSVNNPTYDFTFNIKYIQNK